VVLAVALATSVTALRGGFVYDDEPVVRDDARLHALRNLPALVASPYWSGDIPDRIYRPLTTASFAVDWAVGGGSPVVFHAVNVALHLAVTALVLLLAGALLGPGAVVAALWFAVHPVHVEAFAPAVGRSEVLAALGYLAAVLAYAAESRAAAAAPRGARRAFLSLVVLVAAATAFGAKEHALTLPAMLLLADVWTARSSSRPFRSVVRSHALLWCGVVALAAGYLAARGAVLGTTFGAGVAAAGLAGTSAGERLAIMFPAYLEWGRLLLFPLRLSADYAPDQFVPSTAFDLAHAAGALLVAALLVAAWRLRRTVPGFTAGVAWFLVAAAVASNVPFPTGVVVGERLLYLPSVGAALALGALWERLPPHRLVWPATALALALLGARTIARIPVWSTQERFLAAREADAPRSYRMHWNLGARAFKLGDATTGERELLRAARIHPDDASLLEEIGFHYLTAGALGPADRFSTAAYLLDTLNSGAASQAILARFRAGAVDSAAALARLALRRDPGNEVLVFAASAVFDRRGEPQRVLAAARRCAFLHPEDGALQLVAADAATKLGRCDEARARFAAALRVAHTDAARAAVRRRIDGASACRPAR
jgi:tetratricopeptide (TPR) repeat protein